MSKPRRREPNAPQIADAEISAALAPLEPDAHRRRTAQHIDADALQREIQIAHASRRNRLRAAGAAWIVRGGIAAGYLALAIEAWRALH